MSIDSAEAEAVCISSRRCGADRPGLYEIAFRPPVDERIARLAGDQRHHANSVLVADLPVQLHLMGSRQRTEVEDGL
jgi:hypothetical protein